LKRLKLPGSLGARLLLFIGMAILLVAVLQGAFAYRNALEQTDTLFDYQMQQTAFALRAGLPVDAKGRPQGTPPEDENNEFIVQVWTNEGLRIFESALGDALPRWQCWALPMCLRVARPIVCFHCRHALR
jgi:two-component system OmpR family sensor kinase